MGTEGTTAALPGVGGSSTDYPTVIYPIASGPVISFTELTSDFYYSGGSLGTLKIPSIGLTAKIYEGTGSAPPAERRGPLSGRSGIFTPPAPFTQRLMFKTSPLASPIATVTIVRAGLCCVPTPLWATYPIGGSTTPAGRTSARVIWSSMTTPMGPCSGGAGKADKYIKVTESGANNKARWGGQYFKWWLEEQPGYALRTRYPQ